MKKTFQWQSRESNYLVPIFSSQQKLVFPATYQKTLPHFTFLGQSNVGKSSLLNSLLSGPLAKTSKTPGYTKQIQLFKVQSGKTAFYLTDMPGYGKASKEEWGRDILMYLKEVGQQLKRIYLLIDSTKNVKNDLDMMLINILESNHLSYQICLTKWDQFPEELKALHQKYVLKNIQELIDKETRCCFPDILITSSKTQYGTDKLRHSLINSLGYQYRE